MLGAIDAALDLVPGMEAERRASPRMATICARGSRGRDRHGGAFDADRAAIVGDGGGCAGAGRCAAGGRAARRRDPPADGAAGHQPAAARAACHARTKPTSIPSPMRSSGGCGGEAALPAWLGLRCIAVGCACARRLPSTKSVGMGSRLFRPADEEPDGRTVHRHRPFARRADAGGRSPLAHRPHCDQRLRSLHRRRRRAAPRVVDRMRSRFADAPAEVLDDFRARCGAPAAPERASTAKGLAPISICWRADARGGRPSADAWSCTAAPIPLLPPAMRDGLFAGARTRDASGRRPFPAARPIPPGSPIMIRTLRS